MENGEGDAGYLKNGFARSKMTISNFVRQRQSEFNRIFTQHHHKPMTMTMMMNPVLSVPAAVAAAALAAASSKLKSGLVKLVIPPPLTKTAIITTTTMVKPTIHPTYCIKSVKSEPIMTLKRPKRARRYSTLLER